LVNFDGSNLRRLTFTSANENHPAFSPDGTQIIFNSNRENENEDVYVMNIDGTNPQKVTNWDKTTETAEPGCWSPDGTKILFWSNRNGTDDIYVVNAETIRPKVVLSDAERNLTDPSFSPDGKRMQYVKEGENKSGELRILDLQTHQSTLVQKTELSNISADWSPDGNWIAFSDRLNGNSEIFILKPDGSHLQNLTKNQATDSSPAWSPDGRRIVFSRAHLSGGVQLHIMNADGSDVHPLTARVGWEDDARWFPDGNRILFSCDRIDSPGNMLDVCEINADGTGENRLLFHRDHDTQAVVSPDGKLIAFVAHSDGNDEIYVMHSDGSGLLRLTRNIAADESPHWSPDGRKLVFISNRSGKFAIYEIAL
jgi:Tol biopolymer transport system component